MNKELSKKITAAVAIAIVVLMAASMIAGTFGNQAIRVVVATHSPPQALDTSSFVLNGSAPIIPAGSINIGPANLATVVTIYLGLSLQNQAQLSNLISQISSPGSPIYRDYLSHTQFENSFEPSSSAYAQIEKYYQNLGFNVLTTTDRLYVPLEGNLALIEKTFGVTIDNFETSLGTFYFSTNSANIPSGFSTSISTVIGLSNYPYFMPMLLVDPSSGLSTSQALNDTNNGLGGSASPQPPYTPWSLYEAYNATGLFNSGYQGQYETIAVTDAYGDPTSSTDMATYSALFNVNLTSSYQTIYPYGQPSEASLSAVEGQVVATWEIEAALDSELSHAFAPAANIVSVISPDSGYTLIQSVVYVIVNELANVISNSWGEAETEAGSSITYLHPFLEMAAAEGITVLASSGDNGAAGYDNAIPRSATWPSSDPYITSVGGTTVFMNGTVSTVQNPESGPPPVTEVFNPTVMTNETAWDNYTGGGYSVVYPRPSWQYGTGLPTSGQYAGERGVPDVAAVGMFGGNDFVFNGQTAGSFLFGGTSFASPIWAGVIASIDSYVAFVQGSQVGFVNPTLYAILNSPVYNSAFNDVKYGYNGPNGFYNAGTGWDPVTGLGSPNIGFLAKEMAEYDFVEGAIGDANTTMNTGSSASIQTVVPDTIIGTSSDNFLVSEKLSDGTLLLLGYSVNNAYPLGSVFYGIVPGSSLFGSEFINYIGEGSAGSNGTSNDYAIREVSTDVWAFVLNGQTLTTYSLSATSSGSNPAQFEGLVLGASSNLNTLMPAVIGNMEYRNSTGFHNLSSAMSVEQTNIYSSYYPPYFFPNPYGVELYANNSIKVGSGIPYSNGTVLFGKFYSAPPETVFLSSPQYVTLYAQNVSTIAAGSSTSFPLTTLFPAGQSDFNSFYVVPVAGVSTWNFVLNQSLSNTIYVSQLLPSYVHFYLSLQSVDNTSSSAGVPVTVQVTAHAGSTILGTSSETISLPVTGAVEEYNLSFLSQVGKINSASYISFTVSWYTESIEGENIGYATLIHSGQSYPISISLPVYNPVDISPLAESLTSNSVTITSTISDPFGSYDLKTVEGYLNGTLYVATVSGNQYIWTISTSGLAAGTYNFTVYAYDLQGNYNFDQTSFTISQTVTTHGHSPPAPPPRPPPPPKVGPPKK